MKKNISRLTQLYVAEHPSVKDALSRGLINYSALAREICRAHKIKSNDAVIVACRRMYARLKGKSAADKLVRDLISKSKLRIRSKIAVIITERPKSMDRVFDLAGKIRHDGGDFNLIEGESVLTLITNMEHLDLVRERLKTILIKAREDLTQITMIFDKRLETTSGVVSLIYGLLAIEGINVLEEASCWTDIMLILESKDLSRALKALELNAGVE